MFYTDLLVFFLERRLGASRLSQEPSRYRSPHDHSGDGSQALAYHRDISNHSANLLNSQVLPRIAEVHSNAIDKRQNLLNDLRSSSTGLDPILEKVIPVGVAFHRKNHN